MIQKRLPATNQYVKSSIVDDRNRNIYQEYLSDKELHITHIALRLAVKYGLSVQRVNKIIKRERQKTQEKEASHAAL